MAHPLIEDGHQKGPPLLWLHRALADLVALLKADLSLLIDALNNRDELDEVSAHLITQKPVYPQGMIGIGGVDGREDVEVHLVLLQEPCRTHDLVEGRC